jgi:sigma-B regulation protein RsbU (phosphoserine phosphatase)
MLVKPSGAPEEAPTATPSVRVPAPVPPARREPRLALLVDALDHDYQADMALGVVRAARQKGASLVVLAGGRLEAAHRHLQQRRFVFDLADPRDYDGVILLGGTLSSRTGAASLAPLVERFGLLPMVSVGLDVGVGTTLLVDNASGVRQALQHLIDVHQCARIAFLSGPTTNHEARVRLEVFREELARRELVFDPNLVAVGDFTYQSGVAAIAELAGKRSVDLSTLDAVVGANDYMALGALTELRRRGLRVPMELGLVGFDDIEPARYAEVPLTTVHQPIIQQGERAVQLLMDHLEGTPVPRHCSVEPRLVVRRSCGCGRARDALRLDSSEPPRANATLEQAILDGRQRIQTELTEVALTVGLERGWEAELVDCLVDELAGKTPDALSELVETRARAAGERGESPMAWTAVMTVLEQHLGRLVREGTGDRARVRATLHRARVAVTEGAEQAYANRSGNLARRTVAFNDAATALLTTLDMPALADAAATHLPRLGIGVCSIALLTPRLPHAEQAERLLVIDAHGRQPATGTFPSRCLAAPELVEGRPHALVVEPLCFNDEVYGLAAFEHGPKDGAVYEQIGALLSAAIKAALMAEEISQARRELEALAVTDPLTGVYNRRYLSTRLREEMAGARRSGRPLSLVMLDLDGFKLVNDLLGHDEGDRALEAVARTLRACSRPADVVARIGGDEFVVLLPGTTADGALACADRMRDQLAREVFVGSHNMMAASLGVATSEGSEGEDESGLLRSADRALLAAKRAGKNCAAHASSPTSLCPKNGRTLP